MTEILEQLNQAANEVIEQAAPSRNHLKDIGFDSSRITQFRETWKNAVRGLADNAGMALAEIGAGFVGKEVLMRIGNSLSSLAYHWEIPIKGANNFGIVLPFLQSPRATGIPTLQSITFDTLASAAYISAEAAVVAGVGYAAWKHGGNLITHGLGLYQLYREQKTRENMAVAAEGKSVTQVALLGTPEQLGGEAMKKMLPPKDE